ncbi:Bug family tripartite tricarboxylate transporter substrate binding protein [Ramlibacter sp.]|uniref:Bug family tripartite tricarboxylate transporter substrate binding protein n=1 Tax=Ramlibacter sp. TaxID=1917967 RepID=UPI003D12F235
MHPKSLLLADRRRAVKAVAATVAGLGLFSAPSHAQAFPTRSVRIVVPYQPGGNSDVVGRRLADALSRQWNQPVVVENIAGASGNVGAQAVARAEPDGHTLLFFAHAILTLNPWLIPGAGLNAEKDLAPVARVYDTVNLLMVSNKSGFRSVKDLVAYAKAKPGVLNFGSGGPGATSHLALEAFCSAAGIQAVHVPYKGAGPAALALISGEIDAAFEAIPTALPRIKAHQARAVATGGASRTPLLPDVPTFADEGFPGFNSILVGGVATSSRTPRAVQQAIHRDIAQIINRPEFLKFFADGGSDVGTGSLEEFEKWLAADRAAWGKLIRERSIKI